MMSPVIVRIVSSSDDDMKDAASPPRLTMTQVWPH